MSDRRAVKIAAGVYVALWLASVGSLPALPPCDYQAAAIAQEPPAPPPEPQPLPELTVDLIVPELCPPGTFVPIKLQTNGEKINVAWSFDGKPDRSHIIASNGNLAHATALEGVHTIGVFGSIDGVPVLYSEAVTFGEPQPPEPPKPLNVLITGETATKLADLYRRLAKPLPDIAPTDFWTSHDRFVVAESIVLSKEATTALHERLDKVVADLPKLKAELLAIAGELAKVPDDKPPVVTTPATAATYVYEDRDTPIPVGVQTGINRLNREKKIVATIFDDDTRDGDGEVPDQYRVPLAEAQKAGLPALVVTAGDTVLKVVKNPKTESEVFEAIAP